MSNVTWTMNCVLFGAKIRRLIEKGEREEALAEIRNLSSELSSPIDTYLLQRLEDMVNNDKVLV